ncbi:MAG: AarF/UbiB family protein [Planctomycetota bacterium]
MAVYLFNPRRTIRNAQRAREILQTFARFGFQEFIHELQLDRLVLRGSRFVGLAKPDAKVQRTPLAVRLRQAMEDLGPSFVKMAQILSTRPDLIPPEWAEEFRTLQSSVRPVPADKMRAHLSTLYGGDAGKGVDERFRVIDEEPLGSGSIAQAHRAELRDGTEVVLKVLRPGIHRVIEADVEILRVLARFAESRFRDLGYSPMQIVEQFAQQVQRELDLTRELRSIDRMRAAFREDDRIVFPRVFAEHSTDAVLCMERVHGTLLGRAADDEFTLAERESIVAIGSDMVFRQCFEIGFFHADPHPGNLFVRRREGHVDGDDSPVQLCLIDFGMTGEIDPRTAELLADMVHGTVSGDLDRVLEGVLELAGANPLRIRERALRTDVWEFMSRFETASLDGLKMGGLLGDLFVKVRRHDLEIPADIVYLVKAIATIEGVGEQVCPSFDLVGHVTPHMERLVRRRLGFGALRRRVERSSMAYAKLLDRVPTAASGLLHTVRSGDLEVQLRHNGLDNVTHEIERASRNISYALVISALVVGGAILMLADRAGSGPQAGLLFWAAIGCFVLAVGLGIVRALTRTSV